MKYYLIVHELFLNKWLLCNNNCKFTRLSNNIEVAWFENHTKSRNNAWAICKMLETKIIVVWLQNPEKQHILTDFIIIRSLILFYA